MIDPQKIAPSLEACLSAMLGELSENDQAFVRRVYQGGLGNYSQRLKAYGMEGRAHVLDAGCGFGQWSLALAQMNTQVFAIDAAANRIQLLARLARALDVDNLETAQQTLPSTEQPDSHYDAILCYGVIFITDWKATLRHLNRCLKPGGVLYVNANGLGWFKNLWYNQPNKTADYSPRAVAAKAWQNTLNYSEGLGAPNAGQLLIEPVELADEIQQLGLTIVAQGSEGTCAMPNFQETLPSPFFKGEYLGDTGIHEVIAVKQT